MLGFINLLLLAPTVVGNVVVTDTLTIAKNEQAKITSVKSATSIYGQGTEYQNFDAGSAVCNATVGAATAAGGAAIGSIIPVAGTIILGPVLINWKQPPNPLKPQPNCHKCIWK